MLKKLEIHPDHILRLGLGFVLIYIGLSIFSDQGELFPFLTNFFLFLPNLALFVKIFSAFQIIAGICLLAGIFVRFFSFILFWQFLLALIINGVDLSTYKDFGLITSALALFVLSSKKTSSIKI